MRRRGTYEFTLFSQTLDKRDSLPCLALYNADPASVQIMYAMLLPFGATWDIAPDQLCRQLEREYGLQIDLEADLSMDIPTPEERKRALSFVCRAHLARLAPHER